MLKACRKYLKDQASDMGNTGINLNTANTDSVPSTSGPTHSVVVNRTSACYQPPSSTPSLQLPPSTSTSQFSESELLNANLE